MRKIQHERITAMNLAWCGKDANPLKAYIRWFDICKKHGISYVRIILAPWGIDPISRPKEMETLVSILSYAEKNAIEICLALNTYVVFTHKTYRDFEDNSYGWKENFFSQGKSIRRFLNQDPKNSEYLASIVKLLQGIDVFKNVKHIEFCNEVDQIEAPARLIIKWVNQSLVLLREYFNERFIWVVSIANHRIFKKYQENLNCRCDIHSYRFPYHTAIENFRFYSEIAPLSHLSEYACYSDKSYAEDSDSKTYFACGLWVGAFENANILPAPWWWEDTLDNQDYLTMLKIFMQLDKYPFQESYMPLNYNFLNMQQEEKKGAQMIVRNKIRERLAVLISDPFFIFRELPAIKKFFIKYIFKKYNNMFAYSTYKAGDDTHYILIEAYKHTEVTIDIPVSMPINEIRLLDLIRGKQEPITATDRVVSIKVVGAFVLMIS